MQAADEQERTHTEGRNYCAYNRTQGSFLSLRIATIESPNGSGQIKLQSLANNSQSGLWISPYSELPDGYTQLVFDLVYLDQDCRVIGVESFPNTQPVAPTGSIASALALAPRTITSTLTQPHDEIIIWSLSEAEPQPQRGLRASLRGRSRSSSTADSAHSSSNGSSATSAAKKQAPAAPLATNPVSEEYESEEHESEERPSFFKRLFGGKASGRDNSAPISLFAAQSAPAAPLAPPPPAPVPVHASAPIPTPVQVPIQAPIPAIAESLAPSSAEALLEPASPAALEPVAAIPDPAAILAAPEPELLPSEPVIAEAVLAEPVLAEPVLAAPTEESASSAAIPVQEEPTSEESPAATALQPVAEALPEDTPAEMSPLPSAATLPLPTRRIVAIPGPNGTAYVVQNADEPLSPEVLAPVAESAAPIPAPVAQQPEPLPPAAEPVVAHQPAEAPLPEPQLAVSSPAAATPAAAPPAPARTPDAPPSIPAPEPALAASLSTASQPAAPAPQHQKHDRQRQSHASRKAEKKARARQRAAKSESDRRDGLRRRFTFQQSSSEGAVSGPSLKTRFVRWLTAPPQAAKRLRAPQIVAYFWTGGAPQPHTVANISVTGLYIVTKDRWMLDTVIVMNLQWTDCDGTHPGDTISVLSKVVRFGEDGVGFQFVTSDAVNAVDGQYLPGKGSDRTALDRFLWRRKRLAATA